MSQHVPNVPLCPKSPAGSPTFNIPKLPYMNIPAMDNNRRKHTHAVLWKEEIGVTSLGCQFSFVLGIPLTKLFALSILVPKYLVIFAALSIEELGSVLQRHLLARCFKKKTCHPISHQPGPSFYEVSVSMDKHLHLDTHIMIPHHHHRDMLIYSVSIKTRNPNAN